MSKQRNWELSRQRTEVHRCQTSCRVSEEQAANYLPVDLEAVCFHEDPPELVLKGFFLEDQL